MKKIKTLKSIKEEIKKKDLKPNYKIVKDYKFSNDSILNRIIYGNKLITVFNDRVIIQANNYPILAEYKMF